MPILNLRNFIIENGHLKKSYRRAVNLN